MGVDLKSWEQISLPKDSIQNGKERLNRMRSKNKLFNFIILQSLVMIRGTIENILKAIHHKGRSEIPRESRECVSRKCRCQQFHGKGDRLVASAGRRIKGRGRRCSQKVK